MLIRPATKKDIDNVARIIATSFLLDLAAVKKSIVSATRATINDFILAEENKQLLGCLKINPFETYMRGTKLRVGGIGGVAVLPEHRRRGIAEELINTSIRQMAEQGYPISILYPFQHRFYRKFGWGFVGGAQFYEFSPANLQTFEERQFVRRWKQNDKRSIQNAYEQKIRDGNCALLRSEKFWQREVFPKFNECFVYDDGTIKGYIVFEYQKNPTTIDIFIKELIALMPEAYRGILGFLSSLGEQVAAIKYLAPMDEPLYNFLKEPRSVESQRIVFEYRNLATFCTGFMLRVVHLEKALKILGNLPSVSGEVTFLVHDKQYPENSKPTTLTVQNGMVSVTMNSDSAVNFETDIATFSQLYSGFVTGTQGYWSSKVKSDQRTLNLVDSAFRNRPPFIYQFDVF